MVAVASSPTGAAYQDILKVLRTRAPWIQVVLAPCVVQGPQATESICQAIRQVNDWGRADVLIVTRGGGSAEDLEAYDTEAVIRAVADSRTPVVCAVGHEVDTSLSELAADRRAATPSQAAEIVSPDQQALRRQLEGLQLRSQRAVQQQVFGLRQQLRQLRPPSPLPRVQRQRLSLESMQFRSQRAMQARLQQLREQLKQLRPAGPLQGLQAQRLSLEGLRWRSQHAMQLRVRSSVTTSRSCAP